MPQISSSRLRMLAIASLAGLMPLAGARAQGYCTPTYSTTCTVGDYIQSFSTTGGSTNITNNNTGCNGSANNYLYYSAQTVTSTAGSSFNYSFTNSNSPQYYKIWVDWNNNLSFTDLGEEVYASSGTVGNGMTVSGTIAVPTGTANGTKRLRIRSQAITTTVTPCGTSFYGETEDYNVQVGNTAGCTGMPYADTAYVMTGTACASSLITLHAYTYTIAPGIVLQWQRGTSATGPWNNVAGATISPVVLSQTAASWYRMAVTCTSSAQTAYTYPVYVPMSTSCQDSVWPGDANYDLTANNLDMLALSLSWGINGSTRAGASNSWTPQFAMNWPQAFSNGVNKKNVDCNGDGTTGWGDTVAISQNYGMVHLRPSDDAPAPKTAGLPDLWVDLSGLTLMPGTTVTAPVRFGSSGSPVPKIYGIAATVRVTGTTGSPSVTVNPTWMGNATRTLRFARTTSTATADFAASRITRSDTSGWGTLGTVAFALPANATGKVKVVLQNVTVVDSTGAVVTGYNVLPDSANIISTSIGTVSGDLHTAVILPNPGSSSVIELSLSKAGAVSVQLVDATGRLVWNADRTLGAGVQRIALPAADLPAGIYAVVLRTPSGTETVSLRWVKR